MIAGHFDLKICPIFRNLKRAQYIKVKRIVRNVVRHVHKAYEYFKIVMIYHDITDLSIIYNLEIN